MRKKKRRRIRWRIVLLVFSLFGLLFKFNLIKAEELNPFQLLAKEEAQLTRHEINEVTAKQVLLKERDGKIVYEENSQQKTSIASLTKMMTALCIIEAFPEDLQQRAIIPADIFPYIWSQELATAGFLPDESVSLEDLLYGILLPSGADAALAGAIYTRGTEQAFVEEMNQKAAALGMADTHFANVTGADSDSHFSTAGDLLLLLEYALDNPQFYQIFTSFSHGTTGTLVQPEGLQLTSTLLATGESLSWNDGVIIGGKTGYTIAAGQCLASLANVNGKEYIMILLGADGTSETEQRNIQESRYIYQEYAH